MITNRRQFERDLKAQINLPRRLVVPLHKRAALEVDRKLVLRTPVDRGTARGGWITTVGRPTDRAPAGDDPSGSAAIARNQAISATIRDFAISWHQNPLVHTRVLDEGLFDPSDPGPSKDPRPGRTGRVLVEGGFSTQAPRGMVEVTFREIEAKYSRIASLL